MKQSSHNLAGQVVRALSGTDAYLDDLITIADAIRDGSFTDQVRETVIRQRVDSIRRRITEASDLANEIRGYR